MLSPALYFEKGYMLRLFEVGKRLVFYIIKQVLSEPPGWRRILKFWTRWQQEEPCLYGNLFFLCTRRKPPRDLEIEHVSRTVASVYSHMLNEHWLSQLHSGRPMHWPLQVNRNEGTRNPTLVPEDKLALCIGRTLWKYFVTFSICQYSILVSTYPAATGGINMRLCHVGKVYNFCRRSKILST